MRVICGCRNLVAGFGVMLIAALPVAWSAPEPEPWDMWIVADQNNQATIDHSSWQQILNLYLRTNAPDGINRFDYAAVTEADRVRLGEYIGRLAATDPRDYRRIEQLAYWLNLYNALTVQVVLEAYPVPSIRAVRGGMLNPGPWDDELIVVAGEALTLNDIEHRILRPVWLDPRIHYGVNCASLGCPDLSVEVYTGANVQQLLDAGARNFINHPRGVRLQEGKLRLSSIYDWFAEDFGPAEADLLEHLAGYADPQLAAGLRGWTGRIRYDYDWRLNEPGNSYE